MNHQEEIDAAVAAHTAEKAKPALKRYRVIVVEKCAYTVDVEAEDEEDAEQEAIATMENTEDRDRYFTECTDRDSTQVYEDPPNWELSQ